MNQTLKIALLSVSVLLGGVQASSLATAQARPPAAAPLPAPGRPASSRPAPGRPVPGRPTYDGHGQVLDSRYNHGRYYPPMGTVRPALPEGYRPYYRGGNRYYFSGGIWYAPRGPGFVVVAPPPGLVISVLPPYYSTVWFGGVPYYYADNAYYSWQPDQNGYAVVNPPDNADDPSPPPAPESPQDDLMIYPKNGQSKEQQAADQFECHDWARGQTGFDPTQPGGGVSGDPDAARSNYNRAVSACMQGRGYQVS
jgi:uncharacterized protein DUF6515